MVTFASPQYPQVGAQNVFSAWQDGIAYNPRTITAPGQAATYAANFTTQYFLTALANPTKGGTVSGAGWFVANTTATLTATPASGYHLTDWTGANAVAGSMSATVTMSGPLAATANFAPTIEGPPTSYLVSQIFTRVGVYPNNLGLINSFGQVVTLNGEGSGRNILAYPTYSLLWTPSVANGTSGSVIDLGHLPVTGGAYTNIATGINDWGQVVGTTTDVSGYTTQAFLWSPTTANGTSGTIVPFLGSAGSVSSSAAGINGPGQIVGSLGASSFIWTPSSANGITGTLNTDARLSGLAGINDFGQVVMNSTALYPTPQPLLFTPTSPNVTTGAFTQIPVPPGFNDNMLQAINRNGTVLGASCSVDAALIGTPCSTYYPSYPHGFLWTPTLPNVTTGQTTLIPIPGGFGYLNPAALNASGQVVGTMTNSSGGITPFLYSGGTVYDLSTVSSQLNGGIPVGINDRGQIVINANDGSGNVYLLTPQPLSSPPTPVTASPQSGAGSSQTFVLTFTDPRGSQDLGVVNILINNFIDGRSACYLAYSVPSTTLYLVNDAGTAQGPYAGSVTLGSSSTIQNSQCTVSLTSANGSGNTLSLTLNITFQAVFAGNKILYLAARDVASNSSNWQPMGVWQVPGGSSTTTTSVVGMSPAQGSGLNSTPFTFSFSDTKGFLDLGVENVLINNALDGRHGCYLAYARPFNVLYLVNDTGDGLLPGKSLGTSGTLTNSQCTVGWGSNPLVGNGNNLGLTLNIGFSSGFGPYLISYLAARDINEANNTGWQAMGTWTVQ